MTVDRAQVAGLVSPLIPDRDAVLLQVTDIRVAPQEPQQFIYDRLQMQPLGRDHRKAVAQIVPVLIAEDAYRPGARTVCLLRTGIADMPHEIEILLHVAKSTRRREQVEV